MEEPKIIREEKNKQTKKINEAAKGIMDTITQVKRFRNQAENRKCAECKDMSSYVVSKYDIFVCHRCAGIHRCFISGMYVKGLTTANFSEKEVKKLLEGGNAVSQAQFMSLYSSVDGPQPNRETSAEVMKNFVEMKYIKQQWVRACSNADSHANGRTVKCSTKLRKKILSKKSSLAQRDPQKLSVSPTDCFEDDVSIKHIAESKSPDHLQHQGCHCSVPLIDRVQDDFWSLYGFEPISRAEQVACQTGCASPTSKLSESSDNSDQCAAAAVHKAPSSTDKTNLLDFAWFDDFKQQTSGSEEKCAFDASRVLSVC